MQQHNSFEAKASLDFLDLDPTHDKMMVMMMKKMIARMIAMVTMMKMKKMRLRVCICVCLCLWVYVFYIPPSPDNIILKHVRVFSKRLLIMPPSMLLC